MKKKNEAPVSEIRQKYLRQTRMNTLSVWVARIILLVLIVTIWELAVKLKIIDGYIFSSPSSVLRTFRLLYDEGILFIHIATTLNETLLGFLIASVTGTLVAILLWWSEKCRKILEPYIVVLNALPKIALGPMIIIWCGAGTGSIIFMTVLVTVIVTTINMLSGFMETDSGKILLLKSMGATKAQLLTKLVLPNSLTTLISTLKVNVGLSWIGSIMGEYIVSKQGLGYLIVYGGQVLDLNLVMTATVILCVLAAAMYALVALLERAVLKWK